jgi:hypothetical protein
MGFETIECSEDGCNRGFIRFLRGGETGFVDSVVEIRIDPFVHSFDVDAQVGWEETMGVFCGFAEMWGEEGVEFSVEHADDFAGFVVYYRFCVVLNPCIS